MKRQRETVAWCRPRRPRLWLLVCQTGSWGGYAAHRALSSALVFPTGSTPFPYNPLIMRLQAGVMASPPPPGLAAGSGPLAGPHHAWDEEPKPLLCSQYETLSDSE